MNQYLERKYDFIRKGRYKVRGCINRSFRWALNESIIIFKS